MEFTYGGYNYWFCRGDSRYYRMNKKSYVIEEIPRSVYSKADADSRVGFSMIDYSTGKKHAV